MEYRINKKSHFLAIFDGIGLASIVFTIGLTLIFLFKGPQFILTAFWIFAGGYLILVLPALYIYLEYYLHDRNVIITINDEENELHYKKKNIEQTIAFKDIILFEIFGETGSYFWWPSSTFSFARLITKNGEEFFFTGLIKYKLENIIPYPNAEKRRWLFPSICFYKLVRTNNEIPSY